MKKPLGLIIGVVAVAAVGAVIWSATKSNKTAAPTTNTTGSQPASSTNPNSVAPASPEEEKKASEVVIENFAFSPAKIKVKKGTKVTWTNKDSTSHTVTSDNDSAEKFESGMLSKNQTFSHTFNSTGSFSYHCTPHPNMTATVEVTE